MQGVAPTVQHLLQYVMVCSVDNLLVRLADPLMYGMQATSGACHRHRCRMPSPFHLARPLLLPCALA